MLKQQVNVCRIRVFMHRGFTWVNLLVSYQFANHAPTAKVKHNELLICQKYERMVLLFYGNKSISIIL
jgi:hypothetical protein